VAALHATLGQDNGVYAANRLRSLLAKVFAVAIDAELYAGPNPVNGVKKFREQSRDRFLDAAELKAFFAALNDEPNAVIRDYLHLSLLIGARRSNMLAMRWDDIDREQGVWRIPKTKSGDPQVVPLAAAARTVLEDRWRARPEDCRRPVQESQNERCYRPCHFARQRDAVSRQIRGRARERRFLVGRVRGGDNQGNREAGCRVQGYQLGRRFGCAVV
jgi:integrase